MQPRGRRRQQPGEQPRRRLFSARRACEAALPSSRPGSKQRRATQAPAGSRRWPAASRRWRSRGPQSCAGRRLSQPGAARSFDHADRAVCSPLGTTKKRRSRGCHAPAAAGPQPQQRHPVAPPPVRRSLPLDWRVRHVAAHAVLIRARAVRTGGHITHYGRRGAGPFSDREEDGGEARGAWPKTAPAHVARARAPGAEQGCSSAASGKTLIVASSSSLPSSLLGASLLGSRFYFQCCCKRYLGCL